MKKIIVIVIVLLFWGWSQVIAQEKIAIDFDLYKIKLSFNDKSQKKVHGILYSINDSVIILSDSRKKSAYQTGNYSTTKYPLDQIRKIHTHKLNGDLIGLLIGVGVGSTIGCVEGERYYNDFWLRDLAVLSTVLRVGSVGGVVGAIVGRDNVSAKVGKTSHLVERFNHCAVVKNPDIIGHSRYKIFSMDPVRYQRNIQFEMGSKYRIAFEQPIYKGNSLLLGVGYTPMNLIHVVGEQTVNQYEIKTNQRLNDVEHLEAIKDFTYGRIHDRGVGSIWDRPSQSIFLSYHHFLPEYSIPITLDARSYFGAKPDNFIKLFFEIGVGLSAVKGYDFSVTNKIIQSNNPTYDLEEVITLGAYGFRWETKLDLGFGLRYQRKNDLFWEIKRDFNLKASKWHKASISADGVSIMSNNLGNWTLAIGYNFGNN